MLIMEEKIYGEKKEEKMYIYDIRNFFRIDSWTYNKSV